MRDSYGYSSYRGRTVLQRVLTVVIVLLFIVLLLAVAAFFLLQRYIVYTDDGQARLELPFFQNEQAEPTPVPTQIHPMVVVTPTPVATPTPTSAPSAVTPVRPVALFRAAFTDGNTQALVTAAGGDAALFNMRSNDGSLGYVSSLPMSVLAKTSASGSRLEGQIRAVTDSELYTVARVSCFKDNRLPKTDPSLAIKTANGYNWRDGDNIRWLDPANATSRQYAADVCGELAELGFDELLLDNAGYPTSGDLSKIDVYTLDADAKALALDAFFGAVRDKLEDKAVLAVAVNAAALTPQGDGSGLTAALLGKYAQRVYVLGCETPGQCDRVLAEQGLTGAAVIYVEPKAKDLSPTGRLVAAQ